MTLRKLPEIQTFEKPRAFQWDAPSDVLEKWALLPAAAEADDANTISIYDPIGEDFWRDGFTVKRAAAALRRIGNNPVTVKINSPGGDMFDGIAIYNLLREHPASVNVDIVGIAASAASIIAMAGDQIQMGLGTFLMVHNAWGVVIGNRHDMAEAAELFHGFDRALVDIYAARTGADREAIEAMLDAETFMGASEAVEKGFADAVNDDLQVASPGTENQLPGEILAVRKIDAAMAQSGIPRNERRSLIGEIKGGTRNAASTATHDAGLNQAALRLIETIRKSK